MSIFDNANTNITRKSFGSRVDKTFQREGVIPVKDRKKESFDYVAEAAKYEGLNRKVESRRLNEIKEERAFQIALQEGYDSVRDFLIKDFISEICVESMLVDKRVIDSNLRSIVTLVNEQVDDIGGFKGVKSIAESTDNPLLKNMIAACEAICNKVGERNIKCSSGKACELDFNLNKEESDEYNYLKQANGSETIIDIVKDKVLTVVQDEQKENAAKKEIMDEIEGKLKDVEAPVAEAMDSIFNKTGVEETSLFDSLLRRDYGRLLEAESSAIFESLDVEEDDLDGFEDEEFNMSEIELMGSDGEGEDPEDDDSEDLMLESLKVRIVEAIKHGTTEELSEVLESVISEIESTSASVRMKSLAVKCKESVRKIQESSEEVIEESVNEKVIDKLLEAKCKTKKTCKESDDVERGDDKEEREQDVEPRDLNDEIEVGELTPEVIEPSEDDVIDPESDDCEDDDCVEISESIIYNIKKISDDDLYKKALDIENKIEDLKYIIKSGDGNTKKAQVKLAKAQVKSDKIDAEIKRRKTRSISKESYTVEDVFALMEARCNSKKIKEAGCKTKKVSEADEKPEVLPSKNDAVSEAGCKTKKTCKEETEEVIICPICGQEDCVCGDTITETSLVRIIKFVKGIYDKSPKAQKKEVRKISGEIEIAKREFTTVLNELKNKKQADEFISQLTNMRGNYKQKLEEDPNKERAAEVGKFCDWIEEFIKEIEAKKDTLESTVLTEASLSGLKDKLKTFFADLLNRKVAHKDFAKVRPQLISIVDVCDNMKDLDMLEKDAEIAIAQLEKSKSRYPDAKDKLEDQIKWIKGDYAKLLADKRSKLEKQAAVESFVERLDDSCEKLANVIETHELALNSVQESLVHEVDGKFVVVPFIQPNDCNLSNIEFAYKNKMVCESLKAGLGKIKTEQESMVIERAVVRNIESINESLEAINNVEKMEFKSRTLEASKQFLSKIQEALNDNILDGEEAIEESAGIFNTPEDVDRIFNQVKEYTLIESTGDSTMELVMAEAIVEYTILEAFNTLKLKSFDKDSVRMMARKNISK